MIFSERDPTLVASGHSLHAPLRFSRRAAHLDGDTSSAWAVQDEAMSRAAAGEDIIFLTVGDPDRPTPQVVVEYALEAIRRGRTHYSPVPGEPHLRAAVAHTLARQTGRETAAEQIVIFPGAQSALFSATLLLANPGDEIIVTEPYYATYPGMLAAAGAKLVPARCSSSSGFEFDIAAVIEQVTPSTRAVLFSSPNNPTGATVSGRDIEALADLCQERGIWLLADEVYSNLVYDGLHASAWGLGSSNWTVVINSMSKTYAMTGWRLGWAAAPADLATHLMQLAAANQFGCAQFIQDAAAHALTTSIVEMDQMRAEYRRRRDFVVNYANSIAGLRAVQPAGGMFVMIDVRAIDADDVAFAHALLREEHVAVIPGSGFGVSARGYVRVSLTQSLAVLERAFSAIGRFAKRAQRDGGLLTDGGM